MSWQNAMVEISQEREKIILRDGWYRVRSNHGSHRKYKHPNKKGKVTIPYHEKTLKLNTLKSICKQAQIDWRDYK